MRALLDDDLRCTCGISLPSVTFKLKDLPELIRNICLHFVIYVAKSELDQIKDGLRTLKLLAVMESNQLQFLPLFLNCHRQQLTADKLIGFRVQDWSPKDREDEEANWENYVRATEGKCSGQLVRCYWFL